MTSPDELLIRAIRRAVGMEVLGTAETSKLELLCHQFGNGLRQSQTKKREAAFFEVGLDSLAETSPLFRAVFDNCTAAAGYLLVQGVTATDVSTFVKLNGRQEIYRKLFNDPIPALLPFEEQKLIAEGSLQVACSAAEVSFVGDVLCMCFGSEVHRVDSLISGVANGLNSDGTPYIHTPFRNSIAHHPERLDLVPGNEGQVFLPGWVVDGVRFFLNTIMGPPRHERDFVLITAPNERAQLIPVLATA
jgi:hypothetical protein